MHGHNARLTCRHFDVSLQTFYRWKRRYNPRHLESLEEHSGRLKKQRQPTYSVELVITVQKLREEYPRRGKDKLVVLLRGEGISCSTSTVGRIIRHLKDRGALEEPVSNHVSAGKRQRQRPYAVRKPKDYKVTQPGELVQLDTLDIRPLPGVVVKHFTATMLSHGGMCPHCSRCIRWVMPLFRSQFTPVDCAIMEWHQSYATSIGSA